MKIILWLSALLLASWMSFVSGTIPRPSFLVAPQLTKLGELKDWTRVWKTRPIKRTVLRLAVRSLVKGVGFKGSTARPTFLVQRLARLAPNALTPLIDRPP